MEMEKRCNLIRTIQESCRVAVLREYDTLHGAFEVKYSPPSSVPPSVDPPKTQSAPLCIVPPIVSVTSDSPDSQLQRSQSEWLHETDSRASTASVKSESLMFERPCFHLQRGQSEPLRETDSRASNISMKSASSMFEPLNFNLKKKQSQLTEEISSCSVCEEAVRDPVRLLCGHWSCKQCSHSFWEQYGSTADYSCKTCGRRFKGEPEHQTDSEDDKKNLNLPSASRPAPQNSSGPAGREKRDQDLRSVLLEKTIKRVEMETDKLQAEKEWLQAEKEKSQAEKEWLQAEKEKSQAEKEKSHAEKEKFELEKRKLALEIQSLEQKGKYTNNDQGVLIPNKENPECLYPPLSWICFDEV
ncbi:E3 ubiquitin-protein ligase TRIM39-like [Sparus aurata]|uniref:E3 ubiquitin-protein ligase TRIM39-like n=1 Tax=Sparus aurata TaxID=8175 RepID=UPI0011C1C08E|nr:E3 ubiquitin-protein ligase TRIM39-like [Sparus aurata]